MFSEKFTEKIEEIYSRRVPNVPGIFAQTEEKMKGCTAKEQVLLRYLYGNMPVSDMVNYPFETFLDYARHGAFLWENGLYKGKISEEMFCQYVVYHRINTEDISPCRSFFYDKVKEEVQENASMGEAVLALNYWCAQEATYRASDDRTASPMTTWRSAHGRCGEESTFTVSVLRSMGIPARQVYAPRWSHCDDNHAWVEAWCDGGWHFLGACEPEEILDKGWFLHASSRAMLIHSRWYGSLELAKEAVEEADIVSTQGMTTEINHISTYANTKRICIKVLSSDGKPVAAAQVRIEVLNYSEFFPIAVMETKEDGTVQIELGLGSCRISAVLGEKEDTQLIHVKECDDITLTLKNRTAGKETAEITETAEVSEEAEKGWEVFEFDAPSDAIIHNGFVTEAQRTRQKEKLSVRTELRLKKTGTGNEAEVERFLNRTDNAEERKQLYTTLSEKDALDLKADILEGHLKHAVTYKGLYSEEIFVKYILSPRIFIEPLTDFRGGIDTLIPEEKKAEFRENPALIWEYIESHVTEKPEEEYEAVLTLPAACLEHGIGNRASRELLFVAVCRTLGIPARLNPVDHEMEYYHDDSFVRVLKKEAVGRLQIIADNGQNFVYFQNWSVTRKYPGERKLLDLSGMNPDGVMEVEVPVGVYEVITANRLPNGNVLGCIRELEVSAKSTAKVCLHLEEAELSQMLESVPMPSFEVTDLKGSRKEITEILKGRANLVVWLSEGQEPTEHILNELCERAEEFNSQKSGIVFLVQGEDALKQATLSRTMKRLKGIEVYCDNVEERVSVLGRRFYVDPESIPLIVVADKEANGVYATSGYNVGTADMILKILNAGIL